MTEDRLQIGKALATELFAPRDNVPAVGRFNFPPEIADDFRNLATTTVMTDVWSRPGLEKKNRAMITIAALTVQDKPDQLEAYITAGLRLGVSRQEICEVIMQMAIYGSFPAAIQGLRVANDVFVAIDAAANKEESS